MRNRSVLLLAILALAAPELAFARAGPAAVNSAKVARIDPAQTLSAVNRPAAVTLSTDKPLQIASSGAGDPLWLKLLIAAFPPAVALMVVWLGNKQTAKNTRATLDMTSSNAMAAINQKANELQVERIERWLSDFFGPFMQLSEENKRIADILRGRQPDREFRTLHALLDPAWRKSASPTDIKLISRIVSTGTALRTLIREKAGPTGPEFSRYLSRAAAHFTILELAEAGALTDQTEDFKDYVYPRQLDRVLELERDRLEARREELLSDLSRQHPPASPLVIPAELRLGE